MIQSLCLETNPNCTTCLSAEIDLSSWRNLRSFSWTGFRAGELYIISTAIENNSAHLDELILDPSSWLRIEPDLIDEILKQDDGQSKHASDLRLYMSQFPEWVQTRDHDTEDQPDIEEAQDTNGENDIDHEYVRGLLSAYLAHNIFGVRDAPRLPRLRVLSLTEMPLSKALASVFTVETLTSLTLRTCLSWPVFLEHIMESDCQINLRTFELQCGFQVSGNELSQQNEILLRFLKSFTGLEELYVSRDEGVDTADFFQQVGRQHSTLKRLVEHQRADYMDCSNTFSHRKESHDSRRLVMSSSCDFGIASETFAKLDLDFVGLTCTPHHLVSI
ncbi:hypothetical protein FSARC_8863 [Fusarium sarcochroum]|uniref:Uncharacterized protein n=1 Tax=Fusarium sarcochroum TaxID=1208366 RepID=A0A8H4TS61_9HYPO|nr:hypothetical protein FSARC_8863 [Fusarium sarcochroum]